MNTDIEYLTLLERDLEDAIVRERSHGARPAATPARTRPGHRWVKVAGVAAAFLVVAGAIGFIAGGGAGMSAQTGGGADGSRRTAGREPSGAVPSPAPGEESLFGPGVEGDDAAGGEVPGIGPQTGPGAQRDLSKIVRDGRIGVVVPDGTFGEMVGEVTFIAERNRGFVLSSSTRDERSGTFVLRIPARRFDRALAEIRALPDVRVRFQQIRGDDVTAEFVDTQARLAILLQRRALLRGLLADATTTDEILRISSLIDDVQLRIEELQGRIRFINDQVAEATLRVSLVERNAPNTEPRQSVENPSLGSAWDLAVQGFLRIVGAVIVGLGYLIPLTVLAAIAWVAVIAVRRRGDE